MLPMEFVHTETRIFEMDLLRETLSNVQNTTDVSTWKMAPLQEHQYAGDLPPIQLKTEKEQSGLTLKKQEVKEHVTKRNINYV